MEKKSEYKEDHSEKYEITKKKLEEANAKLIGKAVNPEKIRKQTLSKMTEKDIQIIWSEFKENSSEEFEKTLGYGVKIIKKIGVRKFIEFQGWRNKSDVNKWKTDIAHVIPCENCRHEFTTFELDYALCPKCSKLFDIKRLEETMTANEKVDPGAASSLRTMFAYNNYFREMYRIKTDEQIIKNSIKNNFQDIESYTLLKDNITSTQNEYGITYFFINEDMFEKYTELIKKYPKSKDTFDRINKALKYAGDYKESVSLLKKIYFGSDKL